MGVMLLAATNRPEILDPALLRAGRFDRQVLVDRPDHGGRHRHPQGSCHARSKLARMSIWSKWPRLTPGFTGADLANLVNEAAIAATRRDAAQVAHGRFHGGDRADRGRDREEEPGAQSRRSAAASLIMRWAMRLVAFGLPGADPVQKVSIIPRGMGALGYTMQRPTEDRFLLSISDLKNRIAVLMGGRGAEQLLFDGNISTGAADDLQHATEIAVQMVTKYGMDPTLGQRVYAPQPSFLGAAQDQVFAASEATSREIDLAVRDLLEAGDATARAILEKRRVDLEAGVQLLLTRESLTAEEFAPLRGDRQPAPERHFASAS